MAQYRKHNCDFVVVLYSALKEWQELSQVTWHVNSISETNYWTKYIEQYFILVAIV